MKSITVPFFVDLPTAEQPNLQLSDAEFRFNAKSARLLEKSASGGIAWMIMRGQTVEALVLLVCYGLLWQKQVRYRGKLSPVTEDLAVDLIDAFIDADGDVVALRGALIEALDNSGVYGKGSGEPSASDPQTPALAGA